MPRNLQLGLRKRRSAADKSTATRPSSVWCCESVLSRQYHFTSVSYSTLYTKLLLTEQTGESWSTFNKVILFQQSGLGRGGAGGGGSAFVLWRVNLRVNVYFVRLSQCSELLGNFRIFCAWKVVVFRHPKLIILLFPIQAYIALNMRFPS